MNKLRAWWFRKLGNFFFHINGNLEGIGRNNRREDIMSSMWAKSMDYEEK